MADDSDEKHEGGRGSGSAALAGYDYQLDVSIWLALDLILASKLANEVVLEPPSEEDLEAELAEFEPGYITTKVPLAGYTLAVQVKRRSGDAWTARSVKRLLEHGSDKGRISAAHRLKDPAVRYLLVTDAAINSGVKGLGVRRPGAWPAPAGMGPLLVGALPADAAGRVGIIGSQDDERLMVDIQRLLGESFRVPKPNWENCLRALRDEVRIRVREGGSGRWRREELELVIRAHGGFLASSPELERYVHPTNWQDLKAAMAVRHGALIVGQSGTGKTLATRKLFEELREVTPELTRVPITLGPQQLLNDTTLSPVLYDIEDPWGRFDFDPASRPWNDQLAQILAHATHDRMVIATSRLDVAQSAKALDGMKAYVVGLEAEHYGPRERQTLYRSRIDALPRGVQTTARQFEGQVLAELGTPLEIQKFFDALSEGETESGAFPERLVRIAIDRAHQDSIERTVVEQIEHRKDIAAAAALWGLLKASDKLSIHLVRRLEDDLADRASGMDEGLSPLVNFMIAARNFRQSDDLITYYHPRVEAGIEQALKGHAVLVRKVLSKLIDILVAAGPDQAWGVAAAIRMLAAAERRSDLKPRPSPQASQLIDAWLAERLKVPGGKTFEDDLRLAAAAGSAQSTVSEVARYLAHRPRQTFPDFMQWGPPARDAAWYGRVHGDPLTKPLLEVFIKEVLPTTREEFPAEFVSELDRLADDLTPAFLAAAARAVHFGFMENDDAISAGALRDLAGFEPIVETAIELGTLSPDDRARNVELHLDIVNEVYSDDYAEHLAQDDEGQTAREFSAAFVCETRRRSGWQAIAAHPRLAGLLDYWIGELSGDHPDPAPNDTEIEAVFAAGLESREVRVWFLVTKFWRPSFLPKLLERLIQVQDRQARASALHCLVTHDLEAFGELATALLARGDELRLIEFALDLAELANSARWFGSHSSAPQGAIPRLPAPFDDIASAENDRLLDKPILLSQPALDVLGRVVAASEPVREFRVRAAETYPLAVEDDIDWLIDKSEEPKVVRLAVKAAIARGREETLHRALDHRFAGPAALAMTEIASKLHAPLPDFILAKASARPSPLRKALVKLLAERPHSDHFPVLMGLAKDTWSRDSYGEDDHFPIAHGAIAALAASAPLPQAMTDELYQLAVDTSDDTLRGAIFDLLASTGGEPYQRRLFAQAITPGRASVRTAAADGLLSGIEMLSSAVVGDITAELLTGRADPIAVRLMILLTGRGDPEHLFSAAKTLATDPKRRVFLLIALWVLKDEDPAQLPQITGLLPADHPAVGRLLAGREDELDDGLLADLGSPAACKAALAFLAPIKPGKA